MPTGAEKMHGHESMEAIKYLKMWFFWKRIIGFVFLVIYGSNDH